MFHQQWTQLKTEITFFAKITQLFNGKEKHFSSYVKRNDCATLNIASYINSKSLSKTTPTHATQAKPPNWLSWPALQFGMRLSSSAAESPAKFSKWTYTLFVYLIVYTWPDKYVHMYT